MRPRSLQRVLESCLVLFLFWAPEILRPIKKLEYIIQEPVDELTTSQAPSLI